MNHRRALMALLFCPLLVVQAGANADPGGAVALRLDPAGANDMTVTPAGDGVFEIETTGTDPFLFTEAVGSAIDLAAHPILAFEYFSLTGTGALQVFAVPPQQEALSVHGPGLSRSEGWSSHRVDLAPLIGKTEAPITRLRIDFGQKVGDTAQIRNVVLRDLNDDERAAAARADVLKAHEAAADAALQEYLRRDFPGKLTQIAADKETISVSGRDGGAGAVLVEIPVYVDIMDADAYRVHGKPLPPEGNFHRAIPRFDDGGRDRLYSRWAVAEKSEEGLSLRTHGRYIDTVAGRTGLSEAKLRGRKGLGGFSPGRPVEDIDALGIAALTVNIVLDSFMRTAPGDGRTPYDYGGRTWHTDDGSVANLDNTMLTAAQYGQVVSAIILLNQARGAAEGEFRRLAAHPDADPAGIFVMPNLTDAEGSTAYAAAMSFLAERYSRPDGEFGRIHHWIMHNEVNSGWVWTNMGEKSALRYMDAYHKSMRMAQLIAWQYDPHAKVYISLEHHWNSIYNPHCYKGQELLEILLEFSRAEGDFPWAIAFHPYPENLRDPRAWEDDSAWFSYDTPRITFKNMEVIDAWVKRPEARYKGEIVRDVQFTEQGPNSPDYSEESLRDQAACMAYLWKKMEALDSVSMFHFHNWVDNRHEGGLRIGLRRFPDDEDEPLGKKPVWYVFQALETAAQEEAIEFAKEVIGIADWDEVVYTGEITETKAE